VIFLGETNGQLPKFMEPALQLRQGRRWKRIEVFSIEDLSQAGRPGELLENLQRERQQTEDFLRENAARLANHLALYRYSYAGTYGSLWTAPDGRRRVHVSPRILGVNIRAAPSCDFIDFPKDKHCTVDRYFRLPEDILRHPDSRQIFPEGKATGA
jgi:hypothetical protein